MSLPKQHFRKMSSAINTVIKNGEFKRQESIYRDMIQSDVKAKFAAEP